MNNKEKSLGMALIMLVLLIVIISLSGCRGPVKHLQLSEWHKQQAIKRGAKVKIDTVSFHFKSPEIKFSTTIRPTWEKHSLSKDTLKYTDPKTGASVTTKIGLKDDCPDDCITHVYHEVDCPPQEMTVDVPCETVQAGYTKWEFYGTLFVAAVVFLVIGMFVQGMRR